MTILGILLISGLILSGCTKDTTTPVATSATTAPMTTTAPATTLTPKYGGVFRALYNQGPDSLGIPGGTGGAIALQMMRPCVESLVGLSSDGEGFPVPWLATDWQVSPDYKAYTFSLQKNVKFHDGTDFNAEAAKYNLDEIMKSTLPVLSSVDSVEVVDEYTIRVNLKTTESSFLANIAAGGCTMMSPTALKAKGAEAKFDPVGTGPFKFVSYQRDVLLKYERFDGYWGGKPYLDGIEFAFIADPVTELASFKGGEAQAILSIQPIDAFNITKTGDYELVTLCAGIQGLAGDSAHPASPFADIKVRQAISYAINNEQICQTIGYGYLPAPNQMAVEGSYAYNKDIVGYPYNPQKAKDLLAEAGYSSGLTFNMIYTSTAVRTDIFTAVKGYLADVGVTAMLEPTDRGNYMNARQKGWTDKMINFVLPASPGYDTGMGLKTFLSQDASNFISIFIPDDYQAKLNQANSENDLLKRQALIKELNKMIIDQYCLLSTVWGDVALSAISTSVQDCDMGKFSGTDWHPEKVWLK